MKFFNNKRLIDVACGDSFTVFIAEVYELNIDEENLFNRAERIK